MLVYHHLDVGVHTPQPSRLCPLTLIIVQTEKAEALAESTD
jgi:hypothetical protein